MTKTHSFSIACLAIGVLFAFSAVNANDVLKKKILELYPQADSNRDGLLSDAEEAALGRQALRKYPSADRDGDGLLSDEEKLALLQLAGARAKQKSPGPEGEGKVPEVVAETIPNDAAAGESPVRQGPRLVRPGAHGIGRQIPNLSFVDLAGEQHRLSDFADHKAVVFAMTGTGCPLCLKYAPTLATIERQYRDQGVAFIFVNPNESEERARLQDAVRTHGFQGAYVQDGEKRVSGALGAEATTEVFVLDRAGTLVYRGAVDDQYGFGYALESPRTSFLTNALEAVLANQTPDIQATTSPGCELFYARSGKAHTALTYHNRISRIIQANCIECHRQGGLAPISLENYNEVSDYLGMIRNVVQRGIMPPWFAAPEPAGKDGERHTLHWSNDRSLSLQEKHDLFAWIKAGAPEGDRADAPLPKTFPDGWLIGKPDATFGFPKPMPVKASGTMPYQYVTVDTNLSEDKWVQAIEIRPGKTDVVHHVIVSVQGSRGSVRERNELWAGYTPGNSTWIYPEGYARRLPKGATLRFQMHYTPNGTATEDSTRIGLIFAKTPPRHEVKVAGIANRKLRIPPHANDHSEVAELPLSRDIQVLSFLPHMHLRGKAARYELLTANGQETLLDVPHYDFNWQLLYRLAEPRTVRRGDTIRFTGWFDNSRQNPANPNPSRTVRWGEQTEDEMHLGYIEYVVPDAKPGDPLASATPAPPVGRQTEALPDSGELRIGERRIRIAALVKALRQLDSNRDGKLEPAEVPAQHQRLFEMLDTNHDKVLTTDEVRSAIDQQRAR